ncbi:MAG: vanadium-dependent haloperoxidase, partial [Flavobacteriales bacterium]
MNYSKQIILLSLALVLSFLETQAQSVAREWNELHLNGVRNDLARPTVTARNLWHTSAAMYDAWAAYSEVSETYFLGKTVDGFTIPFEGVTIPATETEIEEAREQAISYAAYRVLSHRYNNLPGNNEIAVNQAFNAKMAELGYSTVFTDTDYTNNGPAALGNYIAEQVIAFGLQDGSNEDDDYDNQYYESIYLTSPEVQPQFTEALVTNFDGNPSMKDPNRWQPLSLIINIDQLGNEIPLNDQEFLSPEWGNVTPFSLTEEDKVTYQRDGFDWNVYCDPSDPPYVDTLSAETGLSDPYKWGNALVVIWSALLDHQDGNMIDISPNNIGNVPSYPTNFDQFPDFYDLTTGLDTSEGYDVNPHTGDPYDEQFVPMGDYGRVLAEFWADGPDSETPPGHWFSILNYVSDNPLLEKRWEGEGPILSDLEWDVKTYFTMGATVHDCAIAAWSIKGYYDYVRPISAIRWMGDMGQCTDSLLPSYHPGGMPLVDGFIELVEVGDTILVGDSIIVDAGSEHLHKIKVKSWKGPDYLDEITASGTFADGVQDSTLAGVGWILTEDWWPYQRPSFVSPPFAGFVSGHSTYSRGAAEVMARMTGDEYFPGGMGIFDAPQDGFLVFENGPSQFLELQWAKYTDASDQCSLSRIFGGIHPPADDIPGRIIGKKIGEKTFELASEYLNPMPKILAIDIATPLINDAATANEFTIEATFNLDMDASSVPVLNFDQDVSQTLTLSTQEWTSPTTYLWTYTSTDANVDIESISVDITGGIDLNGETSEDFNAPEVLEIDTENPTV